MLTATDCSRDRRKGQPNKSLQLSPKTLPGRVNALWQFRVVWVDAAGQLNSMLDAAMHAAGWLTDLVMLKSRLC
jgi:hypothetical protein